MVEQLTIDEMVTRTFSAQTVEAYPTLQSILLTQENLLQITATTPIVPLITQRPLEYKFLREWRVADAPHGYGADILIEDDVEAEELVRFVIKLAGEQDPVKIRVWTNIDTYENMDETSAVYKNGYVLVYIRQTISGGALSDMNEIQWMQEVGKFSNFFGQTIQVMDY